MANVPGWKADKQSKDIHASENVKPGSRNDMYLKSQGEDSRRWVSEKSDASNESYSKIPDMVALKNCLSSWTCSEDSSFKLLTIAKFLLEKWCLLQTKLVGQEHLVAKYQNTLDELKNAKERGYRWEMEAKDLRHKLGQIAMAPSKPVDVFSDRAVKRLLNSLLADHKSLVSIINEKMCFSDGADILKELEIAKSRVKDLEEVVSTFERERAVLKQSLEESTSSDADTLRLVVEQQFDRIRSLTIQVYKQQQHMKDFDSLAAILKSEISKMVETWHVDFLSNFANASHAEAQVAFLSSGFVDGEACSSVQGNQFSWTGLNQRPVASPDDLILDDRASCEPVAAVSTLGQSRAMRTSFDSMRIAEPAHALQMQQSKQRPERGESMTSSEIESFGLDDLPSPGTDASLGQDCTMCPELERKLIGFETDLTLQKKALEEALSSSQQMQRSLEEAVRKLETKEAENKSLKEDLRKSLASVADYAKKQSQLENEVASWTTAAKSFQSEGNEIERASRAQEKVLHDLRAEVASLQGQLRDFRSKCECQQRSGRDPDSPQLAQARKSPTETAFTRSHLLTGKSFSATTARQRANPPAKVPEPYQVMGPRWSGMNVFQGSAVVRDGPMAESTARSGKQGEFSRDGPATADEPYWSGRPEQKLKCEYCNAMFPSSLIMDHLRECMKMNAQ